MFLIKDQIVIAVKVHLFWKKRHINELNYRSHQMYIRYHPQMLKKATIDNFR